MATLDVKPAHLADNPHTPGTLDKLLEPFSRKHQPETSRVTAHVDQRVPSPMSILKAYQYIPFFTHQARVLSAAFVSHHLFGPPKKSWGIEMTLFTTALRASVNFSHLSTVQKMRSAMDLQMLLPMPKDGIVTPVSFKVRPRGLKGMLADVDKSEDGKREITGEWVVHKGLWRKMQQREARRAKGTQLSKSKVILYLHGGAYYLMSAASHRHLIILVSKHTDCRVFGINYRLAPETRFPGQLHDAAQSYFRLVNDLRIPPENILIAGDSAGGGLTCALLHYLRDNDYPMPSAAILMSPWVDLTMSCASWDTNQPFDYLPQPDDDDHMNPVKCLLGPEGTRKWITHPYASPLFGDFTGFPPLLIQCGDAEVLRDEGTLLAHKASRAGVHVEHEIYEDCVHVFQAFTFLEASPKAMQSIRRWIRHTLPKLGRVGSAVDQSAADGELIADAHEVRPNRQLDPKSLPTTPRGESGEGYFTPGDLQDSAESSDTAPEDAPSSVAATGAMINAAIVAGGGEPLSRQASGASGSGGEPLKPILRRPFPARLTSTDGMQPSQHYGHRNHARTRTTSSVTFGDMTSSSPHLKFSSSSHPDLRALLDEYEQQGPAQHTRYSPSPGPSRPASSDGHAVSRSTEDGGDDGDDEPDEADTYDDFASKPSASTGVFGRIASGLSPARLLR